MPKSAKDRPLSVCVLSSHPLVLHEIAHSLSTGAFAVRAKRLANSSTTAARELSFPATVAYVVDGNAPTAITEAVVSAILAQRPRARVIVLVEHISEEIAFPLLRLGIKGLVTYAGPAQLHEAVRMVALGGFWVPRTLLSRFVEFVLAQHFTRPVPGTSVLSGRENQVLDALMENLSNKEIASQLNISERTVKFHVSNLLTKFGVQRRADLIVLAFQRSQSPAKSSPVVVPFAQSR